MTPTPRRRPCARACLVAVPLAALLVLTGCGAQESGLPEVAGSAAAPVEPSPLPEPTVTVTASVAPEPSVAEPSAPPLPEPDGGTAEVQAPAPAADPLPEPEIDAAEEEISYSLPGVGGTVLEAMEADGMSFETKGSGENSFVVSVNGREADDSQREYWALYVNGEYAQLGAGSQQASGEDTITWRLERY